MEKESRIYIAGHNGMVGSSLVRKLKSEGYTNLYFETSDKLNLKDFEQVNKYFNKIKPEYVFLAAAKVGGIDANNTYRGQFIYDNLQIQNNVIHLSYLHNIKKLLFLGSSCIYPKKSIQPIKEEYLLSGPLEETNKPYAIAKIAGVIMCQSYNSQYGTNFISVMPTNLYGPNDNYDLKSSHVLPALFRKITEAKNNGQNSIEIWGTGKPLREFLHVDDLADACYKIMKNESIIIPNLINVGSEEEVSIVELANIISKIVDYDGKLNFNNNYPDGTPRKLLDSSIIKKIGWKRKISLEKGIAMIFEDYKNNKIRFDNL